MAFSKVTAFLLVACAAAVNHNKFRAGRSPDAVGGVGEGKVPTAGEAVGEQTGVDVPNPHQYTGAIVGGGVAGTLMTLAIFCIASYMCYSWNKDMTEKGKEPYCGLLSCLCCCCCTPLVCCFPVDAGKSDDK